MKNIIHTSEITEGIYCSLCTNVDIMYTFIKKCILYLYHKVLNMLLLFLIILCLSGLETNWSQSTQRISRPHVDCLTSGNMIAEF